MKFIINVNENRLPAVEANSWEEVVPTLAVFGCAGLTPEFYNELGETVTELVADQTYEVIMRDMSHLQVVKVHKMVGEHADAEVEYRDDLTVQQAVEEAFVNMGFEPNLEDVVIIGTVEGRQFQYPKGMRNERMPRGITLKVIAGGKPEGGVC